MTATLAGQPGIRLSSLLHPVDGRGVVGSVALLQAAVLAVVAQQSFRDAGVARRAGAIVEQRSLLGLSLAFGVFTVLGLVVAFGLLDRRSWSRPWAVLFESVFVLNAVTLLIDQPVVSIAGTAVGTFAIVMLARGTATTGALPTMASIPMSSTATATEPRAESPRTRVGLGVVLAVAITVVAVGASLLVRSQIVFGLILLALIFIPIERVFALHRDQRILRAHWLNDVAHFLVNGLITLAMTIAGAVVLVVSLSWLIRPSFQAAVVAQPVALQFIEALVLADLVLYAIHRAHHQVGWLWKFHAVHHSIEQMDWLAAVRLHPFNQALDRAIVAVPLFAFGFSNATIGVFAVIFQFQAIFIHANVRFRFGPLRWLIGTPEFHHWHHANEPAALNTNFAGQFPWIDRLFGTAHLPRGAMPAAYGCDEPVPQLWPAQMAFPFRRARPPTRSKLV